MAGVDVASGGGRGRALSLEINMVPMIDLLMVTISFLLITAVWTHLQRLDADANVPHPCVGDCGTPPQDVKTLHVDMRSADKFVLTWKKGSAIVDSIDVPRSANDGTLHYRALAQKLGETWNAGGEHHAIGDHVRDRAVLHASDGASYAELVGVMDAIRSVDRPMDEGGRSIREPAFDLVFSMN
ncbi:MAG TPA: biopolymer transporter ExbD [Polyangiaceae bacterium]